MTEPEWLTLPIVLAIHRESVAQYGGAAELRDQGLLERPLDRPRNLFHYGADPSVFDLAASCCASIVRNHPFVDGNKRAGILAAAAFLELNGYELLPSEPDAVAMIMALADGQLDETELSRWMAESAVPPDA